MIIATRLLAVVICAYVHKRGAAEMNPTIQVLSALSEPTRLAAMAVVWDGGEVCVCDLMRWLKVSQSRMSRHMATLKRAGLVTDRRDAQWVRYRRNPDLPGRFAAIVDAALAASQNERRTAA
jgi:ArsR family transcriptional regulator